MKKILFLEDEERLARLYVRKLERAGYQVLWCATAEDALEKVPEFQPHVVVADHGIKGHEKSGLDILEDLKKISPTTKIIMLSNYSKSQIASESLDHGADLYLLKVDTSPPVLIKQIQALGE